MVAWYVALFVAAGALSMLVTPAVRAAAMQLGAVDHGGGRRVHEGRVPRLGGVALLIAGAGALLLAQALGIGVLDLLADSGWHLGWLGAGALLVLLLGSFDDLHGVGPGAKLAWQTLAALIAVQGGYGFHALTNPFTGGVVWLGALGAVVTVGWIVIVTNAFNLIDGLDGLATGTGLIAAITAASGRPSEMATRNSVMAAIRPVPAARPSRPSMRLKALVTITIQPTVTTAPSAPSHTTPPVNGLVSAWKP